MKKNNDFDIKWTRKELREERELYNKIFNIYTEKDFIEDEYLRTKLSTFQNLHKHMMDICNDDCDCVRLVRDVAYLKKYNCMIEDDTKFGLYDYIMGEAAKHDKELDYSNKDDVKKLLNMIIEENKDLLKKFERI